MKRLFLLFIFLLSTPCSFSQTNPNLPEFTRWVNDEAHVISDSYKAKINNLIDELESKTSAEIAVVTISSIAPYSEAEYAQMLFDQWKIGKKGKDNGVIILQAVKERRWRIQTGYGVEGIVTDALAAQIGQNEMVPYLKGNQNSEALYAGTLAVARLISRDAGVTLTGLEKPTLMPPTKQSTNKFFFCVFGFFFFLVWNIPWPIFIGLPATLLFGSAFYSVSPICAACVAAGYMGAMMIRYITWSKIKSPQRPALWKIFVFGLMGIGTNKGSGGSRAVASVVVVAVAEGVAVLVGVVVQVVDIK